jgi:hypothetical protein
MDLSLIDKHVIFVKFRENDLNMMQKKFNTNAHIPVVLMHLNVLDA